MLDKNHVVLNPCSTGAGAQLMSEWLGDDLAQQTSKLQVIAHFASQQLVPGHVRPFKPSSGLPIAFQVATHGLG